MSSRDRMQANRMSSRDRMLQALKADMMVASVSANAFAFAHLLSVITICTGVGVSACALYWRFPANLPSPSQDLDWKAREELVSLLFDATNMLMAATHFMLEPTLPLRRKVEDCHKVEDSHTCLRLAMGKMSTARIRMSTSLYFISKFRCLFSSGVRKQLTRSFWRFTTLFAQLGFHPYKQLIVGENGQSLTMEKLSEYVAEMTHDDLSFEGIEKKILEEIRDECEILLKVLDPKETRWIPVEEIRRNCKPIEVKPVASEDAKELGYPSEEAN